MSPNVNQRFYIKKLVVVWVSFLEAVSGLRCELTGLERERRC